MGKPKIFTDDVRGAIPRWVSMGNDVRTIAGVLGVTTNTLTVYCSKHGISLRVPGNLQGALRREMGEERFAKLEVEANRRGLDVVTLVTDMVNSVIEYDLFESVLGEYEDLGEEPES